MGFLGEGGGRGEGGDGGWEDGENTVWWEGVGGGFGICLFLDVLVLKICFNASHRLSWFK